MHYKKSLSRKQSNNGWRRISIISKNIHVKGMEISLQLINEMIKVIEFSSMNNYEITL
jgi:hypothetical protein